MGRYKIDHKPEFEIAGIIFIGISLLVLLSLLHPSAGFLGGLINMALMRLAGEGRYLFPVLLAGVGYKMFTLRKKSKRNINLYGAGIIALVLLTALHTYIPENYILQAGWQGDGGGLLGGVTYYLLVKSFGRAGLYIVLSTLFIVGLLLSTNQSLINLLKNLFMGLINAVKKTIRLVDEFLFIKNEEEKYIYEGETLYAEVTSKQNALEGMGAKDYLASADKEAAAAQDTDSLQYISERSAAENIAITEKYFLPPVFLLTKPPRSKKNTDHKDINENIKVLEETLANFGIRVKVTQVAKGPVITRYEVQPPPGIKVSRIVSLADDIALNMASSSVRIEAPVPGKAVVGIEIPNKEISTVYLRELVESPEYRSSTSQLSIALGKDIAGQPVVDDLARMPHLLIAGATGAGKSVCLNTIIAGFLFKATPEQVKIMIIDPKMVELAAFNGIPHLVSPVITGPKKAATSLRWAVKEMEFRYDLFAACGVRDLERYNKLMLQQRKEILPLLVIIIDELADLMMTAPGDVEDAVCRLAQMARAAGIHLIVATQRPSVDIITGLIKANIPSRISFAVSSQIDSRTILDMGGAEKLLGRGDMLFYPVGANKPVRVQGAFLSDREVELLVRHWNQQAEPEYDPAIGDELKEAAKAVENMDDMLPEAVKVFVDTGHASISLLQRRLHIGYSRAARIVDIMEKKGYISGYEGSKPRAVLITESEYKNEFNEAQ